ncbi:hypothetical protein M1C59_06105 [Gordonia terrae]|uniref:hypothetical protein n=1 Tax=Gordonia terrae TaxID=2055 RepID=UPI00200AF0A3|nr:hypothetical protein [Gordonia terrae]UPW10412.1 hypothetical protein M1C59_06105 [Gordonia terrae]
MRKAATAKAIKTREIAHPRTTCFAVDMGAYGSLYSYLYVGVPTSLSRLSPGAVAWRAPLSLVLGK